MVCKESYVTNKKHVEWKILIMMHQNALHTFQCDFSLKPKRIFELQINLLSSSVCWIEVKEPPSQRRACLDWELCVTASWLDDWTPVVMIGIFTSSLFVSREKMYRWFSNLVFNWCWYLNDILSAAAFIKAVKVLGEALVVQFSTYFTTAFIILGKIFAVL